MSEPPPRVPRRLGRRVWRGCVYTFAGMVLIGAVALIGLRLLLPELGRYESEIEAWVSRVAERPVEFGAIDAHWRGWTPVFRLREVRLFGRETPDAEPWIGLADLSFSIDPLESLRSGALQPRAIAARGASLVVVRRHDGSISVQETGSRSPAAPREWGGFLQWVLSRTNVSLSSSRILWVDERRDGPALPLSGVSLHLEQEDGRYLVSGAFELPEAGRIDVSADLDGESFTTSWSGTAYVAAHDVDLKHVGLAARPIGAEGVSGLLSGAVWSSWKDARLVQAEGSIRVESPGVVAQGSRRGFDEVSASAKIERTATGWALAVEDLVVTTAGGSWPSSRAAAWWAPPREGHDGAVVVNAQFARIEDLAALAFPSREPAGDDMSNALASAAPRGVIEDVRIYAPITDRIEIEHARARGRFTGLHVEAADWSAALEGASGEFEAGADGMVAEITAGSLRVGAPGWLQKPIRGERLTGVLTALTSAEDIRVGFDGVGLTTPAGRISAQGRLLVPRSGERPDLSVVLSVDQARIASVRSLIARRALPEPVWRWLESAIPTGDIHDARLTFHGLLSKAPPEGREPVLAVTAQLAVPVFGYARGWPAANDVSAVVRVDGTRLDTRIVSGRILGADVREARIVIDDLAAEIPVLEVAGNVEGTSADAARFLAESPLRDRFRPLLDSLLVHGASALDLRLRLPLKGRNRAAAVEGRIAFDDNRIDLPGLRLGLEAVNGVVTFRNASIRSDGMTATWLGEPLVAAIGTAPKSQGMTRVSIDGRLTPHLLSALLRDIGPADAPPERFSGLLARIEGSAAWSAVLDFPRPGAGRPVRVRAATDLAGIALDLPAPLGKASATTRRLSVDSRIAPGTECVTDVRYGDLAGAALRLVSDAGRWRLDRGTVVFGADEAPLSDTPGLSVVGAVPTFDAGAWYAFLQDLKSGDASRTKASPLPDVRDVSIDAGSIFAMGTRFPATRLRASPGEDGGWRLDLEGQDLAGTVRIPRDPYVGPVVAAFERFVLAPDASASGNEKRPPDPRSLPALSFSSRQFILGERDLGRVTFATVPTERGMDLERLDVQAESFNAQGSGSWTLTDGEHRTEFVVTIHGDDLGRMLGSLGFDGNVVTGGTTDVSLRGAWAGAPAQFALERMVGVMHFLSTDGRLTRVKPGVTGRVFGLLTITSLPRRLVLDFGDLFKDGFEFDRIDGSFAIEYGDAHTDDLFMESDTARFDVVGRTGLVIKDYDQLVTVTPKISSSLPLVPLWLAQKLLDRNVFDKAFSYQYTIGGAWDAPEVEFVKTQKRTDNAE